MKTLRIALVLLLGTTMLMGCFDNKILSDDDESAPQIPTLIIFKGPSSNNAPADLKAKIDELNSKTSTGFNYLSLATVSSPSVDGVVSTWEVSYGELDAVIVAEKKSDDTVDWAITVNGSNSSVSYNNWTAMEGNANMGGTEGDWNIYHENSTVVLADFYWTVDDNDVRNGFLSLSEEDATYEIVNSPDHSGNVVVKEGSVTIYHAIWDETGAGSWTRWDEQGNLIESGSWN